MEGTQTQEKPKKYRLKKYKLAMGTNVSLGDRRTVSEGFHTTHRLTYHEHPIQSVSAATAQERVLKLRSSNATIGDESTTPNTFLSVTSASYQHPGISRSNQKPPALYGTHIQLGDHGTTTAAAESTFVTTKQAQIDQHAPAVVERGAGVYPPPNPPAPALPGVPMPQTSSNRQQGVSIRKTNFVLGDEAPGKNHFMTTVNAEFIDHGRGRTDAGKISTAELQRSHLPLGRDAYPEGPGCVSRLSEFQTIQQESFQNPKEVDGPKGGGEASDVDELRTRLRAHHFHCGDQLRDFQTTQKAEYVAHPILEDHWEEVTE